MLASGEFVIRLVLALGLGAVIGLEREFSHHEAGLKTTPLVAAGAARFVLLAHSYSEPLRVVAQGVSGIWVPGAGGNLPDASPEPRLPPPASPWAAAAAGG